MTVPVDKAIEGYITLRSKKERIEADTKGRIDEIKQQMAKLEQYIQLCANDQGVQSFKTDHGTAFLQTKDFANVADWDVTLKFILDNGVTDMLERRVSKNAVRAYIDQHKTVPPGVNYGTQIGVCIRKPAKKADKE